MTAKKLGAALILSLAFASATQAAVYTVTLTNGNTFESRYRPRTADFDANYALIHTDLGSMIAVKKSEIVDVSSDTEIGGYGYQLNETTLFLGWTPAEGDEDGTDAAGAAADPGSAASAAAAAGGGMMNNANDFQVQDFVDIPESGVIPGGQDLGGNVGGGGGQ